MRALTTFRIAILTSLIILFHTINTSAQLDNYRWTTVETSGTPKGRHENAFVEFKGKLYLLGGRGINPVDVYDPATNTWEARKKSPIEIHHFQAVVYGEAIYLIGAMTGGYPTETPLENIWLYYLEKDQWNKGPIIPESRRRGGAGAVVYNDKIYLVGGIKFGHTSGTTNLFDCYDPKTGQWQILTDAPHIRDHFPAAILDNKLYCVGGRNTSVHHPDKFWAFFNATNPYVDYYDFAEGKWYTLEEKLPIPTAAGGLVAMHNKLLYIGGEGSQAQAYNHVQMLDIKTGHWTQLAPLNMGRHGTGTVIYDNKIYMAAGSENRGGGNMSSMEVFDMDHEWEPLFNGKDLSGWQVMCTEPDKGKDFWKVENGQIVCNSMQSTDHNYVWLQTTDEYSNFELRIKFQIPKENRGNSGVQFRSRYDKQAEIEPGLKGWLDGPQVDIEASAPWRTGLIYDETRSEKRWINPSLPDWKISREDAEDYKDRFYIENEETGWNDMTIICDGFKIKTIVNNVVISDYDGESVLNDKSHQKLKVGKTGHIALQLHKNSSNLIIFRDLEIRRLK